MDFHVRNSHKTYSVEMVHPFEVHALLNIAEKLPNKSETFELRHNYITERYLNGYVAALRDIPSCTTHSHKKYVRFYICISLY